MKQAVASPASSPQRPSAPRCMDGLCRAARRGRGATFMGGQLRCRWTILSPTNRGQTCHAAVASSRASPRFSRWFIINAPLYVTWSSTESFCSVKDLKFTAGDEYQVVAVSFDSRENYPLAQAKKAAYVKDYGHRRSENGWHFLTGPDGSTPGARRCRLVSISNSTLSAINSRIPAPS